MSDLTPLQIAAALAENSYRRNQQDQPLDDLERLLGARDQSLSTPDTLTVDGGYYYDNATGFVGRVVEVGGTIYVVFRGTDATALSLPILAQAVVNLNDPAVIDANDVNKANKPLALGTMSATQFDDALALTRAAQQAANGKPVVVVGQSLGAGLAGLVSATLGSRRVGIRGVHRYT